MRLRPLHGVALILLAGAGLLAGHPASAQEQRFVTIGTGGITGVYYPTGGAICRMVSKDRARHGIRCSVESTGGSVYNIDTMRAGELDMAIVQSDLQYKSFKGQGDDFQDKGPFEDLRAVFSLHAEPFTVVARANSGIATFDDLKGKRVNVGNPGSGQRSTMEMLMGAKGWTMNDFALVSELKSAEQAQALCDDKIDAMVFTVGHPSGSIQEATTSCAARLIPVTGPEVDQLLAQNPYDVKSVIPGGMYPGNDRGRRDVRRQGDLGDPGGRARRRGVRGDQGGVRAPGRVQKTPPRVCRPAEAGDGRPGAVGAAASRRREVLQGSGPDVRRRKRHPAAGWRKERTSVLHLADDRRAGAEHCRAGPRAPGVLIPCGSQSRPGDQISAR